LFLLLEDADFEIDESVCGVSHIRLPRTEVQQRAASTRPTQRIPRFSSELRSGYEQGEA
jgi:hypothetical protein